MEKYKVILNNNVIATATNNDKVIDLIKKHVKDIEYQPYVCIKNHMFSSMNETIMDDCTISVCKNFFESSRRTYINSAILILSHVTKQIFPDKNLNILHSMCDGVYCEFTDKKCDEDIVEKIKQAFSKCVENNFQIEPSLISKISAIQYFNSIDRKDTADLLRYCSNNYVTLYTLDGKKYWEQAPVAPSTGLINIYDIIPYSNGFVFRGPIEGSSGKLKEFTNQERLYEIFQEFVNWGKILSLSTISDINKNIINHNIYDVIKISEALQEKKIALIADKITSAKKKLVFIAGPSSSGKTTFAKKVAIQLRVLGYKAIVLSLDDYFKDNDELQEEQGENLNFEVLEALDLKLLNEHLNLLLGGYKIALPKFDFLQGKKVTSKRMIKTDDNTILIFEGIHGINPGLTKGIDNSVKFKIYISALTHLNFDDKNRIATHDMRLIRRIVRDYKYRGHNAAKTIQMWKKVVEGETNYIFKYQGNSDIMFNSSLVYEMSVLKNDAEKVLHQIPFEHPSYPEAERLLQLLSFFLPIDADEVPRTSLLREFLGGSSFED